MPESLTLSQNQQTVQRLSARQVQYVRLLEMNALELEDEVRKQLNDNPALEPAEERDAPKEDAEMDSVSDDEASMDSGYDGEVEDSYDDRDDAYAGYEGSSRAVDWQIASDGPDLFTYLADQLRETTVDDYTRGLACYIVGNLDESGYLTRTLSSMADDIAITTGQDVPMADLQRAFAVVRELDPAGVGAVDLRDCLLLQLSRRQATSRTLKMAREIVKDYFDLFSKNHFERIMSQMGISDEKQLKQAIELIKSLNPKPGSALAPSASSMRMSQITPDVIVESLSDGRFSVSLDSQLSRLQIAKTFDVAKPANRPLTNEEREAQSYIKLKRDDAEAFIEALRQRGSTLLAVTEAIVRRQQEFFATGDSSTLRPMILKDIAHDTGFDLSVISRATAGKYVATEMGTYPLKMFFNEAPTEDGDTSSHEIMQVIKSIIEAEDKKKPLSDQAIHELMQARGYKLARRTLSKYREKMGIPVARLRKSI